MASRMDRYKKNESNGSRASRNRNLYNTMYSFDQYSNIEGVASMDNENEVDINKVRQMLESRDNYQRDKYIQTMGYDSYLAVGTGLENRMDTRLWPNSDYEMINVTVDDYINNEKFLGKFHTEKLGSYSPIILIKILSDSKSISAKSCL